LPYYHTYYGPCVITGPGGHQNSAPKLSNGFVSPRNGTPNTLFTYQVTYQDADGDPPAIKYVYIDYKPHTMNFTYGNYSSGAIFQFQTVLSLGNHTYYFYFTDGNNGSARLPQYSSPNQGIYHGPCVTSSGGPWNYPPYLYYGSVSPLYGTPNTTFTFQVYYMDYDNDTPTIKNVYIDGVAKAMTYVSGSNLGGAKYEYKTTLSLGSHKFYFVFNDGNNHSARAPYHGNYTGPTVTTSGQPPNNPPRLYYGLVTPTVGNTSTKFTYRIYYYDPDGDPATVSDVYIDGIAHTMTPSNANYNHTVLFKFTTTLSIGNHTFYFNFSDGNATVRLPTTGVYNGPIVYPPGWPNNPPTLHSSSLSPQNGNVQTVFTYRVTYKDLDNDPPSVYKIYIDNSGFDMTVVSGNYTTGAIFQYKTTLLAGNHTYYFYFTDGISAARLPVNGSYYGPHVSTPPPNNAPVLHSGSVSPTTGTKSTVFTYQVYYKDADNDPPKTKTVYIDWRPHVMSYVNGSYNSNTGALYQFKTTLDVGRHHYYFLFCDGTAKARLPSHGSYTGPVVTQPPNHAPVSDAGPDQSVTVGPKKIVYFDGSGSYDPDNDTLVYFWDFSDGHYAKGVNVSHIFRGVGTYKVTLIVWDGQDSDSDTCFVKVTDSGKGKSKPKPKKSKPLPGFDGLLALAALGGCSIYFIYRRRKI
jgi:hypothetical protein